MAAGCCQKMKRNRHGNPKLNVVFYGVPEEKEPCKLRRLQSSLNAATDLIRLCDESVSPQSIQDCCRLGKYIPTKSHHGTPRPLLVMLSRKSEARSILSNKGKMLSTPYSVKRDMSRVHVRQQVVESSDKPPTETGQVKTVNLSRSRKHNVVLYGIPEEIGYSRIQRLLSDLTAASDLIQFTDDSIPLESVRNCYRLGEYKPHSPKPRPLLVTLRKKAEVESILSNWQGNYNQQYVFYFKPDRPPEMKLLLEKRWSLVQSGVEKNDIKISKASLYIAYQQDGAALHFIVKDSQLVLDSQLLSVPSNSDSFTVIEEEETESAEPIEMAYPSYGVDMDHQGETGWTPIMAATKHNHNEIVDEEGVNMNLTTTDKHQSAHSALSEVKSEAPAEENSETRDKKFTQDQPQTSQAKDIKLKMQQMELILKAFEQRMWEVASRRSNTCIQQTKQKQIQSIEEITQA